MVISLWCGLQYGIIGVTVMLLHDVQGGDLKQLPSAASWLLPLRGEVIDSATTNTIVSTFGVVSAILCFSTACLRWENRVHQCESSCFKQCQSATVWAYSSESNKSCCFVSLPSPRLTPRHRGCWRGTSETNRVWVILLGESNQVVGHPARNGANLLPFERIPMSQTK